MNIHTTPFGQTEEGCKITAYRLESADGVAVTLLDYGCIVQSLCVPNAAGGITDVVLGYDTLAEYAQNAGYFGAAIGRVGNRIGGGRFSLNGKEYALCLNDGTNHLHGGARGFDRYVWAAEPLPDGLRFSRLSPDGEEGYPGNLRVSVTYIIEGKALRIGYRAQSDADTLVNLTNHSYFNLDGEGSVLEHELQMNAERFCENDAGCLPTGRLLPVEKTPFDFRMAKEIGRDIGADDVQLRNAGGYDHNYVLGGGGMRQVAALKSFKSGIRMTVNTDQPGMQLYSGNFVTAREGKHGSRIQKQGAVCLETQLFPDAIHHGAFKSPVLRAGEIYSTQTEYAFDR